MVGGTGWHIPLLTLAAANAATSVCRRSLLATCPSLPTLLQPSAGGTHSACPRCLCHRSHLWAFPLLPPRPHYRCLWAVAMPPAASGGTSHSCLKAPGGIQASWVGSTEQILGYRALLGACFINNMRQLC